MYHLLQKKKTSKLFPTRQTFFNNSHFHVINEFLFEEP